MIQTQHFHFKCYALYFMHLDNTSKTYAFCKTFLSQKYPRPKALRSYNLYTIHFRNILILLGALNAWFQLKHKNTVVNYV